jgi:hypothetical protein
VELSDVDSDGPSKLMTEAYLRSMFRIFTFTSLYGPRVIAEPVSEVSAITFSAMTGVELAGSDVQQQQDLIQREINRYPLLNPLLTQNHVAALHVIFDGFFAWLYAQPEPRGSLSLPWSFHDGEDPNCNRVNFTEEERQLVALVQLMKLYDIMHDRISGVEPDLGHHVASLYNPTYPHLTHAVTVYRPRLQLSPWTEPQTIINEWADSEIASLVLQPTASDDRKLCEHSVLSEILDAQLKNRFRLRYERQRLDLLAVDYGVLDPRCELHDA